jgi:hypothetical protein
MAPKHWLIVVLAVAEMRSAHADSRLVVVSAKGHLIGNRSVPTCARSNTTEWFASCTARARNCGTLSTRFTDTHRYYDWVDSYGPQNRIE